MRSITLLFIILITSMTIAQTVNPIKSSNAEERFESYQQRLELQKNSLVKNVELTSIGPTIMSQRITDIEANPEDPTEFYIAFASGGLWKSENNGISFVPLFDNEASMTIGDIAVDWKNGTIIIGTGENNSSRSSYSGTGLYKSSDDGKTWEHIGLGNTHRTGKVLIHPDNPDILIVAALGALYSPNENRGIYKTTDGGTSWKKTLYIDENTGGIDMVMHPGNPDILYSSMWYRTRRAWNLVESGESSGIYKSTDGGENWTLLSTEESGFPFGEGVGRIGLAISETNSDILYALIDNQFTREEEKKEETGLTKNELRTMSAEQFLLLGDDVINKYLDENGFPKTYDAKTVKEKIKKGEITPEALVFFLEDANSLLFDTPVKGAEVYRSDDAGVTWKRTHEKYLDNVFYTFGYYFGEIYVSPLNPDKIYVLGVPILKSEDGGKTFETLIDANVHVDCHALWINPQRDGHLLLGNDGGLNISYDDGKTWNKANSMPVGQFYTVAIDMAKPYNVYGGLQDNGVWYGSHTYLYSRGWYDSGEYPYKGLLGGDGMQIQVDTRDNNTVYTGYQFGNYFRINKSSGQPTYITPKHKLGERPYRFNWQTPIHLSVHNQDILYMGSHRFHRSMDKGNTFLTLSGDLTKGGKKGDVPYGTLTMINESPLRFGLIYVGSDDGLVHVSNDAGYTWENISAGLPEDYWVSRVEASNHDTATVYVSLNGYRWDNYDALIYRSTNYGKTWERIGLNLPSEPVNVIREDNADQDILYVGTDHGLYISLDYGKTFMAFSNNLPAVAVHDLVIHPRDNDLIVGTHGRSIYLTNLEDIRFMKDSLIDKELYLYKPKKIYWSDYWGGLGYDWNHAEAPSVEIVYYSNSEGNATISLFAGEDLMLSAVTDDADKGLNYITLSTEIQPDILESYKNYIEELEEPPAEQLEKRDDGKYYLLPGTYSVIVQSNGNEHKQTLEVNAPKKHKRGEKE